MIRTFDITIRVPINADNLNVGFQDPDSEFGDGLAEWANDMAEIAKTAIAEDFDGRVDASTMETSVKEVL